MSHEHPRSDEIGLLQKTDAELFLLLREGQTQALAILYDRHVALVYGIALQILKNTAEAEDLTQDIFLKLTSNGSYDSKRGSLRTFLAIMTRCRARDFLRVQNRHRKKLRQEISHEQEQTNLVSAIEQLSLVEQSQEVKEALNKLSNTEQKVLKMAYFEGLSQSEMAARLNISLGTIKSRTRRGLLKLRRALASFREKS